MQKEIPMKILGHIHSEFPEKFGIPRQSGIVTDLKATISFEPEFRNPDAFRGLEGFSHIWVLWLFSETIRGNWSPTVRPPRLGGNEHMGVFATRSPYRPNPIGLSCVQLESVEFTEKDGPILHILGGDFLDGTPVLDIKPYLAYVESHPDALGGFALQSTAPVLEVKCPAEILEVVPEEKRQTLLSVLAQDPRPAYQDDPKRVYGLSFAGLEIHFTVSGQTLFVKSIEKSK